MERPKNIHPSTSPEFKQELEPDFPSPECNLNEQVFEIPTSEQIPTATEKAHEALQFLREQYGDTVQYNRYLALMRKLGFTPGEATNAFDLLGYRMTRDLTIDF